MVLRALRMPLAVAAFAILATIGSQTVLADTELGDTGKVGTPTRLPIRTRRQEPVTTTRPTS